MCRRSDVSFHQLLKGLPKRVPRSYQQVLWAVFHTGKLMSAQEIYRWLKEEEKQLAPGLTTVYRSVDNLTAWGYLQCVILSDGEKRYELLVPGDHHHHLRCNHCRQKFRFDECFIADVREALEQRYDFVITSHVIEIGGVCNSCRTAIGVGNG